MRERPRPLRQGCGLDLVCVVCAHDLLPRGEVEQVGHGVTSEQADDVCGVLKVRGELNEWGEVGFHGVYSRR